METAYPLDTNMLGAGLLVARVVFGLLMAAHGAQKLLGWFGGYGLAATGQFMVQLGYSKGRLFATAASASEVLAGLLIAFGLLGPVGPAMVLGVMIVAAVTVHWSNGIFSQNNGIEVPLLFAAAAVALALIGYGPFSLDSILGFDQLFTQNVRLGVIAAGIIGGIGNLLIRRPPTPSGA